MKKSTHISTISWSANGMNYCQIFISLNHHRCNYKIVFYFVDNPLFDLCISIGNTIYYLLIGKSTLIYLQSLSTIMVFNLSVYNLSQCCRPKRTPQSVKTHTFNICTFESIDSRSNINSRILLWNSYIWHILNNTKKMKVITFLRSRAYFTLL